MLVNEIKFKRFNLQRPGKLLKRVEENQLKMENNIFYRSETLNTSKSIYANGGQFPTVYTHNPDLVISARDRTRERHRIEPKYSLTNQNYDRKEELSKFDKVRLCLLTVWKFMIGYLDFLLKINKDTATKKIILEVIFFHNFYEY